MDGNLENKRATYGVDKEGPRAKQILVSKSMRRLLALLIYPSVLFLSVNEHESSPFR